MEKLEIKYSYKGQRLAVARLLKHTANLFLIINIGIAVIEKFIHLP